MDETYLNNSPLKVKKFKQTLILEKLEMKYEKLKKKQIKKLSKDLLNMSENTLEHNLPNESFCAKSVHSQQNINNYNQDQSSTNNYRTKPSRLKNTKINVKFVENISVGTNNTNSDTISVNNYNNSSKEISKNNDKTGNIKMQKQDSFNRKVNQSKSSNLNSLRAYIETENCLGYDADYIIKKDETDTETKHDKSEIIHKRLKTNQSKTTNVSKDVSPNKAKNHQKKLNFFEYPKENLSTFVNNKPLCKVEESDSLYQKIPTKPKHKNSLSCFSFFCN